MPALRDELSLAGRVAAVTGGSRGIGRAIAEALPSAQPRVQVGLFDRRATNEARRRRGVTALLNREAESRLRTLESGEPIETRIRIVALCCPRRARR